MKLEKVDKAFPKGSIDREVAYMIANSHEYKTPNEDGAIKLVKNYQWSKKNMRIDKMQGIDKPVNKEKVFNIAKTLKLEKLTPFMVVDKFQGITPQTKGHSILLDGHHRKEACEFKGIKEVPVYYGKYTGGAEKSIDELIENKANEILGCMEKIAEKRYKFKDLQKYKIPLTAEEKRIIKESKAMWSSSDYAIWKAFMPTGDTVYVTNTHRAFNTAPTLKGAISRFHNFIKSTASEDTDNDIEKRAGETFYYHASPVQGIKKFRLSEDTSGNNKGEVLFASKYPSFSAAFGLKWNDRTARFNVLTKDSKVPTEKNYLGTVLKYTDNVDIDKPCSMYKIKGDFKPLRYKNDIESITTSKDIKIIFEEQFNSFKDMAKEYGLSLKKVSEGHVLNQLKGKKTSNFEKKAKEYYMEQIEKEAALKDTRLFNAVKNKMNTPMGKKITKIVKDNAFDVAFDAPFPLPIPQRDLDIAKDGIRLGYQVAKPKIHLMSNKIKNKVEPLKDRFSNIINRQPEME